MDPQRRPGAFLARFVRLAIVGFLLFGNWEWLQGPFYDNSGISINTVVWYRLHCTFVDVVILLACAVVVALVRRRPEWLGRPQRGELLLLTALGTVYTAASEQINVAALGTWHYSSLMPLVPGTSIGLLPLLQWAVIPPLAAWAASHLGG